MKMHNSISANLSRCCKLDKLINNKGEEENDSKRNRVTKKAGV